MNELVLVTGGSGFIAAHCIVQLLDAGYQVRTTVRSLVRALEVRQMVKMGGAEPTGALTFAVADLTSDDGWAEAVSGCDFVLHVASPFPIGIPRNEADLILPAREGALRVLRASRDAGVRRVVLTSSFAAVGYGPMPAGRPFDERDWTDPEIPGVGAYVKSKTLSERAAWDFMEREGGSLELAVVNPVGVFGPVLGPDYSTSIEIVKRLMDGSMPGSPRYSFGIVDVRDVADLHLRAMTDPAAKGERFLAIAGDFVSIHSIAQMLRQRLGADASRVPTRVLPDWIVRLIGVFNPGVRQIVPDLGKTKAASHEKAVKDLGWSLRSNEEAILSTAESLVRLGLIGKPKRPS